MNLLDELLPELSNHKIIGLIGVIGSGKDTTARDICNKLNNSVHLKFAKYIRIYLMDLINSGLPIPNNRFNIMNGTEYELFKKSIIYEFGFIHRVQVTGRTLMIGIGKSKRREDPEYWIKHLHNEISNLINIDHYIISDVRFENEIEYIYKNNGKVLYIDHPNGNQNYTFPDESEYLAQQLYKENYQHLQEVKL